MCNWCNTGLINLGEFGEPRWTCHGCCKRLLEAVIDVRESIHKIVVVKGDDSGVVLLSDEGSTKFDEQLQAHIYEHEHFSPLGDALVALHHMTDLVNHCCEEGQCSDLRKTHGCKACGEERVPVVILNTLLCPVCSSPDIVCIE